MTSKQNDLEALFALDSASGPARRISSVKAAALVDAALAGANFAEGTSPAADAMDDEAPTRISLRAAPQRTPVAQGPRRFLLAAAALALFAGGTAAGAYLMARNAAPAPSAPPDAGRPTGTRQKLPAPVVAPPEAPVPALVPEELPELTMPIEKVDTPRKPRPPEVVEQEADDLLARANALRGQRLWKDAEATYQEVAKKYPRSAAAYVAQVASAGLRLDHLDDPAGAKKLYQRALTARPSGPLVEEARYGLARALRALGDSAGERDALETFVRAHPASPLRARAQKRLGELGTP